MSSVTYTELKNNYNELLSEKLQLYSLIEEGLNQVKQGKVKPMKESIKLIREMTLQQCIS